MDSSFAELLISLSYSGVKLEYTIFALLTPPVSTSPRHPNHSTFHSRSQIAPVVKVSTGTCPSGKVVLRPWSARRHPKRSITAISMVVVQASYGGEEGSKGSGG